MDQTRVVTRFAPSPTGSLHVGGARTALFNWAFARQHKGQFILRIEDTDVARSTQAATLGILRDLDWLGLDWDQGPAPHADNPYEHQKGEHGPYFQSQRLDIYRRYLQQLQDAGRVYEDGGALRFRMPDHPITVNDLVLGPVRVEPGTPQMEDFVIFKSEAAGSGPTFHFANVVDDHLMRVTHVIRGQEHLNNTVKHLALFEALGVEPPHYAHIPLIFNPDGSKMSKRDKAKAARQAALEAIQAGRWRRDELVEEAYNRWRGLVTLTDEPKRDIPREMFDAFLD
ncbi:MAG TPA: glutamate--tRNA ligase family protein, partial [Phycisphaeraceae bacterium]